MRIEHHCPQCGAPAVFEEAERLYACPYCRVKSYLLVKDFFRYTLPPKSVDSDDESVVYVPYWRFKGTLFVSLFSGVKHRFADLSSLGVDHDRFPVSLGLRSQVFTLRFPEPGAKARFLSTTEPPNRAIRRLQRNFWSKTPGQGKMLHRDFIGETASLLYAPYQVKPGGLFDAVLDERVADFPADRAQAVFSLPGGKPAVNYRFIAALCPGCGWDLTGGSDSLALTCDNCRAVWQAAGRKLQRLPYGCLSGGGPDSFYLPFWRFKTRIVGWDLKTFADYARLANLPVVIQDTWKDIPFHFLIPAFKAPPAQFLRIARLVTHAQPRQTLSPDLPPGGRYPVNLPPREGAESVKIVLAELIRGKDKLLEKLPDVEIQTASYKLIYIPFTKGPHEYLNPDIHLAIHQSTLSAPKNL